MNAETEKSGGGEGTLTEIVTLFFNMFELMCPELLQHSRRLARSSEKLAKDLGWTEQEARQAYVAGLLHDVGHLVAPLDNSYWNCNPKDTQLNMEAMHPELGSRLLRKVKSLEPVTTAVRHHHEHFDGSGFPDGLEGEEIPVLARLVAVAHAYEILVHGLSTTKPMNEAEARQVIREDAGIILDPRMVEVFIESLPALGPEDFSQTK